MLIGMTVRYQSATDRKLKRIGFTLIRNGKYHKTEMVGHSWGIMDQRFWPPLNTLWGRQDVENLKLRKMSWSQWGSGDEDLSGLRLFPFEGEDSGILGETRYGWAETELHQRPI